MFICVRLAYQLKKMKIETLMITNILMVSLLAMINVGSDSRESTVDATASCEETPNGNVEHCTLHDEGEKGGGALVDNHAGTQAGVGGHDVIGCSGGSGFHEGVPNNEPVGSGANGLRNCD